ncbi:hypothetical protein YC2023_093951 [Brassica napus]
MAQGGAYRRPEALPSLSTAHLLFATEWSLSLSLPCPSLCFWRLPTPPLLQESSGLSGILLGVGASTRDGLVSYYFHVLVSCACLKLLFVSEWSRALLVFPQLGVLLWRRGYLRLKIGDRSPSVSSCWLSSVVHGCSLFFSENCSIFVCPSHFAVPRCSASPRFRASSLRFLGSLDSLSTVSSSRRKRVKSSLCGKSSSQCLFGLLVDECSRPVELCPPLCEILLMVLVGGVHPLLVWSLSCFVASPVWRFVWVSCSSFIEVNIGNWPNLSVDAMLCGDVLHG